MRAVSLIPAYPRCSSPSGTISLIAGGMTIVLVLHGHARPGPDTSNVHAAVDGAMLMAAMMLPLAGPSANLVAQRSFRDRRGRAAGEHAAGYAVVWFVFGIGAGSLVGAIGLWVPDLALFTALVVLAAAWQISDRRCRLVERADPIHVGAPDGWGAHLGEVSAGATVAFLCVRRCWASMLAMVAAPHVALMGIVIAANLLEWAPGANPFPRRRRYRPLVLYFVLMTASATWLGAPIELRT